MLYGHVPSECIGQIDNLVYNFRSSYSKVDYTCKKVDGDHLIELKFKLYNDGVVSSPYELEKAARDISKLTSAVYDVICDEKLRKEMAGE